MCRRLQPRLAAAAPVKVAIGATTVRRVRQSGARFHGGDGELGGESTEVDDRAGAWALACFFVGYSVMHHGGLFGSAEVGSGTRLADWIDLATPFAVVLPLLGFMWLQRPRPRWMVVAALGSMLYVEGHGIHLSANSISNVAAAGDTSQSTLDTIHLWDEVVGHYAWFLGLVIATPSCTRL